MVNLKLSPSERKAEMAGPMEYKDGPEYPWGMRLDLDEDTMSKLGLKDLEIGQEFAIVGRAVVVSYSASRSSGYSHTCAGLQITDIDMKGKGGEKPTEDVLYGKDD